MAETQAYEERLLSFLLELRDPDLEITYVSSLPVASAPVDYHISMLPATRRSSARRRLDLVAVGTAGSGPLTDRLLEREAVLAQIRRTIPATRQAWVVPYNSTTAEWDLGRALGIPVYGADPVHAHLGTKSGARSLFALAGVRHPMGAERVSSVPDVVEAIGRLRNANPGLSQLVVKLDRGVSGEGNAIIELADLPAPEAPGVDRLVEDRVRSIVPEAAFVSAAVFLDKLAAQGGVVEERITGVELRSPSVQLDIAPTGRVDVVATHDQILGGRSGQRYVGCRFPADPAYAGEITAAARCVAERLARVGVIGRFGIDFVVARRPGQHWEPFALELNLRMGGTTHPQQTLVCLTGGAYSAERATFITPNGEPRHYVANDYLETPGLSELGAEGVLAVIERGRLAWDAHRGTGAVFHMLGSVEPLGRIGVTTIAESAEGATALYQSVEAALSRAGRGRLISPRGRRHAAA